MIVLTISLQEEEGKKEKKNVKKMNTEWKRQVFTEVWE